MDNSQKSHKPKNNAWRIKGPLADLRTYKNRKPAQDGHLCKTDSFLCTKSVRFIEFGCSYLNNLKSNFRNPFFITYKRVR